MTTVYRIHTNELTEDFLNSIRSAFKDRTIEVIVSDELKETSDVESLRSYAIDEDSFEFWQAKEEDLYQDYLKKKE